MMVPLDLTFHNMERDELIAWEIDAQVTMLETVCDAIIGCHVVVEATVRQDQSEPLHGVSIVLALPCREIKVPRGRCTDADVYLAIRNAFESVRRQLRTWLQERTESVSE